MFVAVILAFGTGLVYSVARRDVNTGIGLGTAVLGVFFGIQGLLVLLSR